MGIRPGSSAGLRSGAPIVRASTSVATLATWWSPNAISISTLCAGVSGSGSVVMWSRVAVRLAAVPHHLDHRQEQRPLALDRIGRVEDQRVVGSKSTLRVSRVE